MSSTEYVDVDVYAKKVGDDVMETPEITTSIRGQMGKLATEQLD